MSEWSPSEIRRTIEEIKRRSLIDPEFRALALSDSLAAIAKVNPRPVPEGLRIRFMESHQAVRESGKSEFIKTIALPDLLDRVLELSEEELQEVAGGEDAPAPKLRT